MASPSPQQDPDAITVEEMCSNTHNTLQLTNRDIASPDPTMEKEMKQLEKQLIHLQEIQRLQELDPRAAVEVWKAHAHRQERSAKKSITSQSSSGGRSHSGSAAQSLNATKRSSAFDGVSSHGATLRQGFPPPLSITMLESGLFNSQSSTDFGPRTEEANAAAQDFIRSLNTDPSRKKFLKHRQGCYPQNRLLALAEDPEAKAVGGGLSGSVTALETQTIIAKRDVASMNQDIKKWTAIITKEEKEERTPLEQVKRNNRMSEFCLEESINEVERETAELKVTERTQAEKIGLLTSHVSQICGSVWDRPQGHMTMADLERGIKEKTHNLRDAKHQLHQQRGQRERTSQRYANKLETLEQHMKQLKEHAIARQSRCNSAPIPTAAAATATLTALPAAKPSCDSVANSHSDEGAIREGAPEGHSVGPPTAERLVSPRERREIDKLMRKEELDRQLLSEVQAKSLKVLKTNMVLSMTAVAQRETAAKMKEEESKKPARAEDRFLRPKGKKR